MEAISKATIPTPVEVLLERRFYPRFEVQQSAVARLHSTMSGQIINISENGLAFRYITRGDHSMESTTLHISTTDRTFNLGMIPIKVVRDVAMPGSFSSGAISLRHCSLEFENLQDYQIVALRYFIQRYAKRNCQD